MVHAESKHSLQIVADGAGAADQVEEEEFYKVPFSCNSMTRDEAEGFYFWGSMVYAAILCGGHSQRILLCTTQVARHQHAQPALGSRAFACCRGRELRQVVSGKACTPNSQDQLNQALERCDISYVALQATSRCRCIEAVAEVRQTAKGSEQSTFDWCSKSGIASNYTHQCLLPIQPRYMQKDMLCSLESRLQSICLT